MLNQPQGDIGAVMTIQTFGDYGRWRWHPHLHIIVADGLFVQNGSFRVMPKFDLKPLQELFRTAALKLPLKEDQFSVHNIRSDGKNGTRSVPYV